MKIRAVCLDCGDTLVDEATEVKNELEETQHAELIPGAAAMVRAVKALGYPLALVADGPRMTFYNVLTQHQLYDQFDAFAISGDVGVTKPDARMFRCALDQLGITPADYPRVVMVGNHLGRDIKGANELGIISVWLNWSPRRSKIPVDDSEVPRYTIQSPEDLPALLEHIEQTL
jgi:HAD superfamily hydrolase (TIGR01549 family)